MIFPEDKTSAWKRLLSTYPSYSTVVTTRVFHPYQQQKVCIFGNYFFPIRFWWKMNRYIKTRQHSSRMHTARLVVTTRCQYLWREGVSAQVWCLRKGRGYLTMWPITWFIWCAYPPLLIDRMMDRCPWNHHLSQLRLRPVINTSKKNFNWNPKIPNLLILPALWNYGQTWMVGTVHSQTRGKLAAT